MAVTETIQELLQGIDDAQYGRDMRQFIHKAIQKCYEEGSAGETDLRARESIEKILEIFGDVENSSTASKAYAEGECFIYDGRLYIVTSSIAQGDAIVVGENIEETKSSNGINGIYKIPCTKVTASGVYDYTDVYIIPLINLMMIEVRFKTDTGVSVNNLKISESFPVAIGRGNLTNQWLKCDLLDEDGAVAGSAVYKKNSLNGNTNQLSVTITSPNERTRQYSGQIITIYGKLNNSHPFSEATVYDG